MKARPSMVTEVWQRLGPSVLPFADAATDELPLPRILRLALFQVSVGMVIVLLNGTLNRVMIIEMSVPAWLVSAMLSLPLVFAPLRALIGFRSDTHRSALGWRRVPYIWMGTLLQFGGLAIMPFALILLSGDSNGPAWIGHAGAALAFLLAGAGLHTTQTAGLALATDLATPESRPRVVALLYVLLLVGTVASALVLGALLSDFSQLRLIQVIQGAAVVTMVLNCLALWKQEPRNPSRARREWEDDARPRFREGFDALMRRGRVGRFLLAVGLGTVGFTLQEILLEPYGGEILGLPVGATTALTALLAAGTLVAFALSARWMSRGVDLHRLAASGALVGVVAFSLVIFAAPMDSPALFVLGTALIGFGGGLFGVSTLSAAMALEDGGDSGLALGAWGAVYASAAGAGILLGGGLRDLVSTLAEQGLLGPALTSPVVGYGAVYHLEILLLFATLIVIGPLVGSQRAEQASPAGEFGLAQFPG